MSITLTPELDELVHERLASGTYSSVEEVLKAALQALREEEQATIAAINEGYQDLLADRVYSLEESNAEFYRKRGIKPPE